LGWVTHRGPFQPRPCWHSVILWGCCAPTSRSPGWGARRDVGTWISSRELLLARPRRGWRLGKAKGRAGPSDFQHLEWRDAPALRRALLLEGFLGNPVVPASTGTAGMVLGWHRPAVLSPRYRTLPFSTLLPPGHPSPHCTRRMQSRSARPPLRADRHQPPQPSRPKAPVIGEPGVRSALSPAGQIPGTAPGCRAGGARPFAARPPRRCSACLRPGEGWAAGHGLRPRGDASPPLPVTPRLVPGGEPGGAPRWEISR